MTSSLRISRTARASMAAAMLVALTGAAACRQDMHDGPRYKPLQASEIFPDNQSARPIIEGTVPRGFLKDDDVFYTGMLAGANCPHVSWVAFLAGTEPTQDCDIH